MSICPVDGKQCPDDVCHGAGCVRASGQPMLDHCDGCGRLCSDDDLDVTGYCWSCLQNDADDPHGFDDDDDGLPSPAWAKDDE